MQTAEIAGEPGSDLRTSRTTDLGQEGRTGDEQPWRAVPALGSAGVDERLLDRVQFRAGFIGACGRGVVGGGSEAFDRADRGAIGPGGWHEAAHHGSAVEIHGAGPRIHLRRTLPSPRSPRVRLAASRGGLPPLPLLR